MFAARLSKAGTESEMTEIFTGDILRFGSDVVDKSRNVTQKCVIMRVALQHPGGEDQVRRDFAIFVKQYPTGEFTLKTTLSPFR